MIYALIRRNAATKPKRSSRPPPKLLEYVGGSSLGLYGGGRDWEEAIANLVNGNM
jgi:hypothetical protein